MAKLRYKKLASGKFSIYIDSYLPATQKRSYEFLKLYVSKDYSKTKSIVPGDKPIVLTAESRLNSKYPIASNEIKDDIIDEYPKTLIAFVELYYRNTNYNRYLIQHLRRFLKGNDIEIEKIDNKWIQKFEEYLVKQELADGSIAGYLTKLKTALNRAVECKLITVNPIQDGQIKAVKKESLPFLTENKVDLLISTEVPFQEQIKDAFLFSMYSGLGWTNIYSLLPSQIIYNENNGSYFVLLKYAGSEIDYFIELDKSAKEILLKYYEKNKRKVFDKVPNSKNTYMYLQLWAALAGISGKFSFSVARNTFAMCFLKDGGSLGGLRIKLGLRELASVRIYEKMHQQL
jgi:site-specific recombinase XerD